MDTNIYQIVNMSVVRGDGDIGVSRCERERRHYRVMVTTGHHKKSFKLNWLIGYDCIGAAPRVQLRQGTKETKRPDLHQTEIH